MKTTQEIQASDAAPSNCHYLTCNIREIPEISKNGCGWEPAEDEDDQSTVSYAFSSDQRLQALRNMVKETGGQDLAKNANNPLVSKIDVVIEDPSNAGFYVHTTRPVTTLELVAIRDDLASQLSDGWGESFEQMDFGLQGSSSNFENDYKLGFSFDRKSLSQAVPYDPDTMPSAAAIAQFIQGDQGDEMSPRPAGLRRR